jgi:hypothetical protein
MNQPAFAAMRFLLLCQATLMLTHISKGTGTKTEKINV